jgi:hypothetical protein
MALYDFRNHILEVCEEGETGSELAELLHGLSCRRTNAIDGEPSRLSVRLNHNEVKVPPMAREVFRADEFHGFESGDDFYLTDGSSLFHLRPSKRQADVCLSLSFFSKPLSQRESFWAFVLLKLLRSAGSYSLHAAGIVSRNGSGLLIIGGSGGGKSTLAIELIRQGWGYLSDDAVLLRVQPAGVVALPLRTKFYVDSEAAASYEDLPLGEEVPDTSGRHRRRIRIEDVYPEQNMAECVPHVLLFSRIVSLTKSSLVPVDRIMALNHLLAGSGPQLFDRGSMARHLGLLKKLVQQAATYELRAGLDLYRDPAKLVTMLQVAGVEA